MSINSKKLIGKRLAFFVFFIITHSFVIAQDFRFSHITQVEGLSQGVVNCILQDSRGFMWIGTQDGLNRYDGYNIKVFKHIPGDSNSLSNNFIFTLYEDKHNTLWIGTAGGGLDEYNLSTGKFTTHLHSSADKNSISDNTVYLLFQDLDGQLLVGTENGLDRYDSKKKKFSRFLDTKTNSNSLFKGRPQCIINGKDGRLWIGTYGGGINSFDRKTRKFRNYRQLVYNDVQSEENIDIIRTIYEDELGILVIGTYGKGIQFFDTHSNCFIKQFHHVPTDQNSLSNDRVISITKDEANIMWIGTFGNGIDLYNKRTGHFQHITYDEKNDDGLNNNTIRCVYHDRTGVVWIGTEGGGVNVYFPNTSRFRNIKKLANTENSLKSNTVFAVIQDKDSLLWIGTDKGGVYSLDLKNDVYKNYPKLSPGSNNSILSLCEGSDGEIWVGTFGNGLCSYNKKTEGIVWYEEFQTINSGTIINIFEDSRNNIWVSTYGDGIFVYDHTTKKFKNYNLKKNELNSKNIYLTFEDKNHNIWIGTDGGGVNKLNSINNTFTYFTHDEKIRNSISSNTVLSINQDTAGNMWFGTQYGLNKFDQKTGKFDFYFEKDGLPNDVIYCVLFDKKENIWMSTNNGISKFNPYVENENGIAFSNYDASSGLQGLEYNQGAYFKNKAGNFFIGGVNGLNIFNPNEAKKNHSIPPVHFTSFKRLGREVPLDTLIYDKKFLELSWRENFFSFDFAALDYQMPGKNKYKYKLEGVDDDWSHPSTQRTASYTQLQGGTYVFRVLASNNDGIWDEKGASIIIHIIPPFWQTRWFYALCILLVLACFWGYFKFRTNKIVIENKILEEKVEERTLELAQKNKNITSSIEYAKRIQLATLPPLEQIYKNFPDSFVFYKPKDIVSGDFYWFGVKDKKKIVAVVDCTGHGVPGAFMSMIGHNLLNQIVNENGTTKPDVILSALNQGVQSALRQGNNVVETSDGMDVAICTMDNNKNELQFAGAFRPLLLINESELKKIEGDKFPIGGMQFGDKKQFTCHTLKLSKGDTIYLTSDGYTDQFGGVKGKKFMAKKFHEILISIQDKTMKEQAIILEQTFNDWRGDIDQVDDILILGIRI